MKITENKIIKNILWLIFDKSFILILQFFVGVKIANYYGSQIYGVYNYIFAIVGFSSILFSLVNGRVIKTYYKGENDYEIVYNINRFQNIIAIVIFFIACSIKYVIKIDSMSYYILIFLTLDNVLLTATVGIENYYEYKLDVKKIVLSNNIVKFISYTLQYGGILLGFSIVMIPIVRCIGDVIRVILLKWSYRKHYTHLNKKSKININLIKNIIKDSIYLWGSFVAYLLYTQIDKIMLGNIIGVKVVGIYTVALQLISFLMIIIGPIQTIIFTKMLELYKENYEEYIEYYSKINLFLTQLYIFGIIISFFVLRYTFNYVFDSEYNGAIYIYYILTIGVIMKVNGALQTGHITLKDITKKSFYKTIVGVFINFSLNYIFIRKYGAVGAAWSTSITQIFTLFILDFFIKEYREHAWIQLKSFNTLSLLKYLKKGEINGK